MMSYYTDLNDYSISKNSSTVYILAYSYFTHAGGIESMARALQDGKQYTCYLSFKKRMDQMRWYLREA